jgi:hypothetical protein
MLALALELVLDLDLDSQLALTLAESLDRAIASARDREENLELSLDTSQARLLRVAVAPATHLDHNLEDKPRLDLIRERVRYLASARELVANRKSPSPRELYEHNIHQMSAYDIARPSVHDRARTSAHDRARISAVDRDFERRLLAGFTNILDQGMTAMVGTALSDSIAVALNSAITLRDTAPCSTIIAAEFSRRMIEMSSITGQEWIISFDAIIARVRDTVETLQRWPASGMKHFGKPWEQEVVGRLERTTVSTLSRHRRLEPGNASAMRLSAVCLAAQPLRQDTTIKSAFRELAAASTLLERRYSGQMPPTENLLIALA